MTQQLIERFTLHNEGAFTLSVPFALEEHLDAKYLAESGGVSLFSTVNVDRSTLAARYVYIRVTDSSPIVDLRVSSMSIPRIRDGYFTVFDATGYLTEGENTVEITLDATHAGAGIFGSVELLKFSRAAINGITVSEELSGGAVNLKVSLDVLGSVDNVRAVATLVSGSGQIYYGGLTGLCGTVTVRDPLYWWPKGLGIQNLYKLTVNLYGDMEIEDTLEVKVGLRSFSASRSANASMLEVNGDSFLPMGAIYRPDIRRNASVAQKREAAAFAAAARCGFNSIVVPADAAIPTESALCLCDAYGIAVAVGLRLNSKDDLARLERLRGVTYHPSLAVLDVTGDESLIGEARERLRHIAPDLPISFTESEHKYISIPSLPTEKTLAVWLDEEERNVYSEKVEAVGAEVIGKMIASMSEQYLYPSSLSEIYYVSAVNAASRVKKYITSTRTARGTLGRAVFSSLSDSECRVSDSSTDAYARWKALQYCSARFFAPVILTAEHKGGGYVNFSVSNERRQSFVGTLEYKILDRFNKTVYSEIEPCEIEKLSAKLLFSRELSKYVIGHEKEYYLEYILRDASGIHSKDVLFFTEPKKFNFADPNVRVEIVGIDRRFSVTVSASAFASAVELEFTESDVVLSDNFFELTSNAPLKLALTVVGGIETAQHLLRTMKVRTLYDLKKPREI